MKRLQWVVVALSAALVAAMLLGANERPEYQSEQVQIRTIEEKFEAVGEVQHRQLYSVAARSAGGLRLFVEAGEYVSAEQALFEVTPLIDSGLATQISAGAASSADELARQAYTIATTKSPAAAEVLAVSGYEQMTVAAGTPVMVLGSKEMNVSFFLPQRRREDVSVGHAVQVQRGEHQIQGCITSITPQDGGGQYLVTAQIPNSAFVRPGMQVDVAIVFRQVTAPSVSLQALQGTKLHCLVEGRPVQVGVVTGLCDEMYAELVYGPQPGTTVVLGAGGGANGVD